MAVVYGIPAAPPQEYMGGFVSPPVGNSPYVHMLSSAPRGYIYRQLPTFSPEQIAASQALFDAMRRSIPHSGSGGVRQQAQPPTPPPAQQSAVQPVVQAAAAPTPVVVGPTSASAATLAEASGGLPYPTNQPLDYYEFEQEDVEPLDVPLDDPALWDLNMLSLLPIGGLAGLASRFLSPAARVIGGSAASPTLAAATRAALPSSAARVLPSAAPSLPTVPVLPTGAAALPGGTTLPMGTIPMTGPQALPMGTIPMGPARVDYSPLADLFRASRAGRYTDTANRNFEQLLQQYLQRWQGLP